MNPTISRTGAFAPSATARPVPDAQTAYEARACQVIKAPSDAGWWREVLAQELAAALDAADAESPEDYDDYAADAAEAHDAFMRGDEA